MPGVRSWSHGAWVRAGLASNLGRVLGATPRSRTALAAENLFLRKPLALYRERQVKPRRASDPLRRTLVLLARSFAWREALTLVQPATLVRWHREAFRLFWRWRSRPGRPRLPAELQAVMAAMARDTPTGAKHGLPRGCFSASGCTCRRARSAGSRGRARGGG